MLHELTGELVRADVTIAVARANEVVLERLGRAELVAPKGPVLEFATINAAVKSFRDRTGRKTLAPSDPALDAVGAGAAGADDLEYDDARDRA
jgi:hypothetical protein